MPMKQIVTLLGASAFMLGILSSGAEAKKVYYEIDGKQYSYSTNNHAQTAEARKRIQAAKAAEAAKAKAAAEKSSNFLLVAFGSKAQREAAEAEEKLKQALAGSEDQTVEPAKRFSDRRIEKDSRRGARTGAYIREASADKESQQTASLVQERIRPPKPSIETPSAAIAEPLVMQGQAKKVRSVSFDVESGIKTTIMIDGSVEEEPFDSSVLSQLASEHGTGNSLMAFVKQLRKASPGSPDEATGSIIPTKADRPELVEVGLTH